MHKEQRAPKEPLACKAFKAPLAQLALQVFREFKEQLGSKAPLGPKVFRVPQEQPDRKAQQGQLVPLEFQVHKVSLA